MVLSIDLDKMADRAIDFYKDKKLKEIILKKIESDSILICKWCSGFLDKDEPNCPLCGEPTIYVGGDVETINCREYDENKVCSTRNEGIYQGRYSRNEPFILSN